MTSKHDGPNIPDSSAFVYAQALLLCKKYAETTMKLTASLSTIALAAVLSASAITTAQASDDEPAQ
jgi:hypothetical protein